MQFVIYKDRIGEYRWRLLAANGQVIADSGEGYKNRLDCVTAIGLVKASANAPINER